MIDTAFLHALRKFSARLEGAEITWALTGSLSFALQGVPVEPRDIDAQTDEAGAYVIERRCSEYVVRPVAFSGTEKIRSHFGALVIDGVKVEIMGALQKRLADGSWEELVDIRPHLRFVEIEDMRVPVLALEYEYQAYLTLGRYERAALLKRTLEGSP